MRVGFGTRDETGLLRELCSAYADPSATYLRKLIVTAIPIMIVAGVVGGVWSWVCNKFRWFEFDEELAAGLGALAAVVALLVVFQAFELIDFIVSGRLFRTF